MEVGRLNVTSVKALETSSSGAVMLDVPVLPSEVSATLTGLSGQRAGQLAKGVTKGAMDFYYSLADDGKFHALSDVAYVSAEPDLSTPQSIPDATWTEVAIGADEWNGHLGRYDVDSNRYVFPSNCGKVYVSVTMSWAGSGTGIRGFSMTTTGGIIQASPYRVLPPDSNAFSASFVTSIDTGNTLTNRFRVYQSSGGALNLTGFRVVVIVGLSGIGAFPHTTTSSSATDYSEYWPDISS